MSRRILLILALSLPVALTAAGARGQDQAPNSPSSDPVPTAAPPVPASLPEDLVTSQDQKERDTGGPATEPKKTAASLKKAPRSPASGLEPSDDRWKEEKQRRSIDDKVIPAQAPAPSAGQSASAAGGAAAAGASAHSADSPLPAADRLPLGKQSVAVTVDVQAPSSMNLNQDATLKLIIRNTGVADAFNVQVSDELPDGLSYVSSQPEMHLTGGQHLSLFIATLPAGSDRVITIKVKPTKTGPFDHAATVRFETGCKSRTRVLEPKLKVDIIASPTVGKVLKGQSVEFKVSIQNTGDGPARNVAIQAKLSPGLRHESSPKSDEQMLYELTLPELAPGATERLDPLVADAILGGEQKCAVSARSPDVVFNKDEAENTKTIDVVEPKLKLTLDGPESRYTDTVADYKITLENPGTAATRKIRVLATLPISGRLVKAPEARYDNATRRLSWTIDQLEPGPKSITLSFQVRVGGIGSYDVVAEAIGEGALKDKGRKITDVIGMPDVDLVVSESKRVLDVGGTTTFQIRLRNYGTKEATHLQVTASLSKNLKYEKVFAGADDVKVAFSDATNELKFVEIDKLGANKEMILGILVRAVGEDPKLATCKVSVIHDDLADRFEDMAGVKITTMRRTTATAAAATSGQ